MSEKLLDLSTEIKRDFITIDGEQYELCAVDNASLDEFIRLGRGINKIPAQLKSEKSEDGTEEEDELMQFLSETAFFSGVPIKKKTTQH